MIQFYETTFNKTFFHMKMTHFCEVTALKAFVLLPTQQPAP